jgi:hypothetical protein
VAVELPPSGFFGLPLALALVFPAGDFFCRWGSGTPPHLVGIRFPDAIHSIVRSA